jgi:hypothetical protein
MGPQHRIGGKTTINYSKTRFLQNPTIKLNIWGFLSYNRYGFILQIIVYQGHSINSCKKYLNVAIESSMMFSWLFDMFYD